jgi:CubicO group peptidase (beta-lactamase class C family)
MTASQIDMPEIRSSFTCTCGDEYSYGFGVRTRTAKAPGSRGSLGEFGWDGAAGADLLVDPQRGISAVLMQHVRNWPALLGSFHLPLRDSIYEAIDKV